MHVARPSASVSSRSSVGAVSREPVQGVALLCPPAVARPSLRPPSVRVCRKDAAVVTVATQCLTTLSWAVWPRCPPAKTFLFFAGGWIRVSLLSTSHSLCPTHLAATVSPVAACTSAQRSPSPPSRRGLRRGSSLDPPSSAWWGRLFTPRALTPGSGKTSAVSASHQDDELSLGRLEMPGGLVQPITGPYSQSGFR